MTAKPAGVGDLRLSTIVVNSTDMRRTAAFWSTALGYTAPDRAHQLLPRLVALAFR